MSHSLEEMAEAIARYEAGDRPVPMAAGREEDMTVITARELFWPNVYVGASYQPGNKLVYGCAISAEHLPVALAPWAKFVDGRDDGRTYASFRAKNPPVVVALPGGPDLTTILNCTRAANLPTDMLLTQMPVKLAIRKLEYTARFDHRGSTRTIKSLAVVAIQVNTELMTKRYDELCAGFFADASHPRQDVN